MVDSREEPSPNFIGPHLALIGVQVFFGSLPVIGKIVLKVLPAASLVGIRVGITAVVFAIVQTIRGRFWLKRKEDYGKLAILSFFGVVLNQLLFITGLSLTKASNTSLLAVTIPIFTLLVSSVIGTERPKPVKIVGLALAAVGVIILIDPRNASFSSQTTIGDLMIIGNSLAYGVYVATSKETIMRNGAFRSMMWVFIFASVICVPYGISTLSTVDVVSISPTIWLITLYIAVGATASPYLLNAWALARVNPSIVAVYIYLQPLIGFMLAVLFLAEPIGVTFAVAAVLIFVGVFLVTLRRQTFETKAAVERI
ncbi:MAG TPA: DMT family transporter [Pyrinomonadaceae bacterium]|nr:DMT family transporter [Pyrinomonadaceae bacterium]